MAPAWRCERQSGVPALALAGASAHGKKTDQDVGQTAKPAHKGIAFNDLPSLRNGGDAGIRTLDTGFGPYAPLAGECLRPLGHVSG